ncbi:MAG: STAS domain-containing protein [Clostridia bacterium]|nr:STAS domain-containing protein [Clostridia bacterium]
MKIDFNKNNGELTVVIDGRLDTVTAPELESFLGNNYEGTASLVFDCEKLIYISSAGLRVLLTAHKRMKGAMKLTNVSELVMEVLEMTGFADIWVIA